MIRQVEPRFYLPRRRIHQQHIVGKFVGDNNLLLPVCAFHDRQPGRSGNRRSVGQPLADLVLRAPRGKVLQRNRNQPLRLKLTIRKAVHRYRIAGVLVSSAFGCCQRIQADIQMRPIQRKGDP